MPVPSRSALPARRRGFVFSSLLLILALLAVLAGLATAAAVAIIYPQLPPLDELTHYQPRQPLQVLTREGIEIAQFGSERREFLPLAQIPQRMQDILVAVEDVRFREHGGIDYRGIARALLANLAGRREGASTITQQVARNFYLSSRRTLERKLKEAALALKIEQQLSKDQILELYMNQIYLGQRAYGFGAAARVYFGKPLAECSVAEMAMLAGLPKNPSFANPITHFERATARQHVVLGRLLATDTITQAEHDAALAQKLVVRTQGQTDVHAEHVAEMARREVVARLGDKAYTTGVKVTTSLVAAEQQAAWLSLRKSLLEHERRQPWRGPEDEVALPDDADDAAIAQALKDSRDDEDLRVAIVLQASPRELTARLANGDTVTLSGDGLRLAHSGLGPKASEALRVQRGSIIRVAATAKGGWTLAQWPEAEGALVALDSATGRVRALVGGYDFARQPFNHATQAWRQPGSSFKPLLYSAALEQGVMPATLINDAPLTIGDWSPQNSDGQFDGPLTLRQALARSKNLVSVRLLQQIGVPGVRDWAARFGLERDKQPDNLTLALGAGSVTPMQMAAAYAVFANGGFKVTPRVIEKIVDAQGTVLYEAPAAPALVEAPAAAASAASSADAASAPASAPLLAASPAASAADGERVIPARNAFVTRALLQEVTRSGTAARAQATLKRPDLYGKTGTTNDAVDAWFAGFQPAVVAVVWIGYDEPRSLGARESGGGLALPAWLGYMQQALKGVPVQADAAPEGVVSVDGDWRYAEFASGGFLEQIGLETPPPAPAASAASTAGSSATSGP